MPGGDDPERGCEPEGLRLAIERRTQGAAVGGGGVGLGIYLHPLHRREIDDHAAVAGPEAGDAVATAPDGDGQLCRPCEAEHLDHVRHAGAARDQRRMAIDRRVPDLARLLVATVAWRDQLAA
jgi:hypothetical protein